MSVLVVLDVDGVLNILNPESDLPTEPVDDLEGNTYPIRVNPAVIEALDEQINRPGVSLGWLTTWGHGVQALVDGPFQGRLAHGQVIATRPTSIFVPIDWKLRALIEHLDSIGPNSPYVWADDDAVKEALLFRPVFAQDEDSVRLLLDPHREIGLTMKSVEKIAAFIDAHGDGGELD